MRFTHHRISSSPSLQQHVDILKLEYDAMYTLVTFRMTSLERRVPIAGAALAGFLGSVAVLPRETKFVFLLALPLAVVWYLRTTVNHARSFEDVLRRLDEIEHDINAFVGANLLRFQSQHPSRGKVVGGRTGHETTTAVFISCVTLLAACVYLFATLVAGGIDQYLAYAAYVSAVAIHLVHCRGRLQRYRYERRPRIITSVRERDERGRSTPDHS